MKITDGTLHVSFPDVEPVRTMVARAARSYYLDSPNGPNANLARALAREGDELEFAGDDLNLLRGVAAITYIRGDRENQALALREKQRQYAGLALGMTALATNADPRELDRTMEAYGLDEATRTDADVALAARYILALTAPPTTDQQG